MNITRTHDYINKTQNKLLFKKSRTETWYLLVEGHKLESRNLYISYKLVGIVYKNKSEGAKISLHIMTILFWSKQVK